MAQESYIYTIAVEFLYFSSRIQRHFTLRFAPKHTALCTKMPCVQHQNAPHLVPKRSAFSSILHCIQQQIAQKLVQMAVLLNKNSFYRIHKLPPFASKPTFARIVFLRSNVRLADKKALTMLKFLLKSRQKLMS